MKAGVQSPVYATIGAGVVNCAFTIVSVTKFISPPLKCSFMWRVYRSLIKEQKKNIFILHPYVESSRFTWQRSKMFSFKRRVKVAALLAWFPDILIAPGAN